MRHEGDAGEERVWLIHKSGFSLACVVPENVQGRRGSELSRQTSLVRSGGRESYRVVLHKSGQILDVEEEDLEKVLFVCAMLPSCRTHTHARTHMYYSIHTIFSYRYRVHQ